MKKETMSLAFALLRDETPEPNTFKGMASVFNNIIDSWVPTRILEGAFRKTLVEQAKRVKVLYQHNEHWPIGIPTRMEETTDGLYVEAKISETQMGKDVLQLMKDGVLTELSIGFDPVRSQDVDEGGMMGHVRHISECRLWEFSPVTFAANSKATISSVNSLFSEDDIKKLGVSELMCKVLTDVLNDMKENPSIAPIELLTSITRSTERHEGKVLSSKNRTIVSTAVEALQALLAATEPKSDNEDQSVSLIHIEHSLRELELQRLMLTFKKKKKK